MGAGLLFIFFTYSLCNESLDFIADLFIHLLIKEISPPIRGGVITIIITFKYIITINISALSKVNGSSLNPPHIKGTISCPIKGIADNKFVITVAPQ